MKNYTIITEKLIKNNQQSLSDIQKKIFSSIVNDLPLPCLIKILNHFEDHSFIKFENYLNIKLFSFLDEYHQLSQEEKIVFFEDLKQFSHHRLKEKFLNCSKDVFLKKLQKLSEMSQHDEYLLDGLLKDNHRILMSNQPELLSLQSNFNKIVDIFSFKNNPVNQMIHALSPSDGYLHDLIDSHCEQFLYLIQPQFFKKSLTLQNTNTKGISQFLFFSQQLQVYKELNSDENFGSYYSHHFYVSNDILQSIGKISKPAFELKNSLEKYQHIHHIDFKKNKAFSYTKILYSSQDFQNQDPMEKFFHFYQQYYFDLSQGKNIFQDKMIFVIKSILPRMIDCGDELFLNLEKFLKFKSFFHPPKELELLHINFYHYLSKKSECININSDIISKNPHALFKQMDLLGLNIQKEINELYLLMDILNKETNFLIDNDFDYSSIKGKHHGDICHYLNNIVLKKNTPQLNFNEINQKTFSSIAKIPESLKNENFYQNLDFSQFFNPQGKPKIEMISLYHNVISQKDFHNPSLFFDNFHELTSVFYLVFSDKHSIMSKKIRPHIEDWLFDLRKLDRELSKHPSYQKNNEFNHFFYISTKFIDILPQLSIDNQLTFFKDCIYSPGKNIHSSFLIFYNLFISEKKSDNLIDFCHEQFFRSHNLSHSIHEFIQPFLSTIHIDEFFKSPFSHIQKSLLLEYNSSFESKSSLIDAFFKNHQELVLDIIKNNSLTQSHLNYFFQSKEFFMKIIEEHNTHILKFLDFMSEEDKINILISSPENIQSYFKNKFLNEDLVSSLTLNDNVKTNKPKI